MRLVGNGQGIERHRATATAADDSRRATCDVRRHRRRCGGIVSAASLICCDAITYNLCQSIYAQSSIVARSSVGRSTLLGVAFAPGRRRQCIKRAIIVHLFSGVLALRSAKIWRSWRRELRRSDQGRLKPNRTRIYSPIRGPRLNATRRGRRGPRCGSPSTAGNVRRLVL